MALRAIDTQGWKTTSLYSSTRVPYVQIINVKPLYANFPRLRILRFGRGQTTHWSVVGLAKGEEQNVIREIWKHDSEGEVIEELTDAAPQVTIQW